VKEFYSAYGTAIHSDCIRNNPYGIAAWI
jgi:hypothetical protein